MKAMKKFGALLCAAALVFGLAACGGDNGGTGGDAGVNDILTAADKKLSEVKSAEITMMFDMAMAAEANGEKQDMNITADATVSFLTEPVKFKGDVNLDMGELGGKMSLGMYGVEENEVLTMYIGMMGYWMPQSMDLSGFDTTDEATGETDIYAKNDFKAAGEETINDVKATKYTGKISGSYMEELMNDPAILEAMEEATSAYAAQGLDIDMAAMFKGMGDMSMSIWVSEDGFPVRYEVDAADMANKMVNTIVEQTLAAYGDAAAGMDMSMSFSKLLITVDIKNIDSVEDFEIPAEVTQYAY